MPNLKVLFQGWTQVPHSYACVNCFQLIHLYKNFKDEIDIYVDEKDYFRPEWNNAKKLVYTQEYNDIIRNFKKWNGEKMDLVYSITYPYNVSTPIDPNTDTPKCVFYTSEFAMLDTNYFTLDDKQGFKEVADVINCIERSNLYFTSPSLWSSHGLRAWGIEDGHNRIITHGVDTGIFKRNVAARTRVREFYKVKDSEILLLNIGAMTQNKGIVEIISALNDLVNKNKKTHYKLLLKGTGDLYQSRGFLEVYFRIMEKNGVMTGAEKVNLLDNHILFIDKTFSYSTINELYNASDIYVSPYLAEGFGLVPLEALAGGLHVLVPKTGSTKEYMQDIFQNGGKDFIHYVDSVVVSGSNGFKQNVIQVEDIVHTLETFAENRRDDFESYDEMRGYIEKEYSWDKVSRLLYEYFLYITRK
jgi:glycosyltransferase involved in cell wall biosynthesis